MSETIVHSWEEANQIYLMAELAEVRAMLEKLLSPPDVAAPLVGALGQPQGLPLRPLVEEIRASMPAPPAVETLCATFGLSRFERKILLMCAGVELDSRFAGLIAAVNKNQSLPTFSLALAAFDDAHWSALLPAQPLRFWRLVEVNPGDTLTTSPLRIDERILHYLAGMPAMDERLRGLTDPVASISDRRFGGSIPPRRASTFSDEATEHRQECLCHGATATLGCAQEGSQASPSGNVQTPVGGQSGGQSGGHRPPLQRGESALPASHRAVAEQVAGSWARASQQALWPVVQLCGIDPSAKRAVAATACGLLGLHLRLMPAQAAPRGAADIDLFIRLWEREAALDPSGLLLEYDEAETPDAQGDAALKRLIETLRSPLLISTRERTKPVERRLLSFEVPKPTSAEQFQSWKEALGAAAESLDGRVETLVTQFSLSAGSIHAAVAQALQPGDGASRAMAVPAMPEHGRDAHGTPEHGRDAHGTIPGRDPDESGQDAGTGTPWRARTDYDTQQAVSASADQLAAALWDACRMQARPRLDNLAQRLEPAAAWDDLVLPEVQKRLLRQIALHVRQRSKVYQTWGFASKGSRGLGISALFAGPSGTGKTMAGEVLANELRLDLYRIDLSQVVSKYIGETEKNLRRVFDAAEGGAAILLFDEADALFGKRSEVKDSHDRYANIEVGYLLQRMEAYRGLAILTTNRKEALDFAFLRRIRFVVEFPFPEAAQRAEIWRRVFPRATPTEGLRIDRLARLSAAGGNIYNIAMGAAFLAADAGEPVRMSHLLSAARSEFTKIERPLTDAETAGWV